MIEGELSDHDDTVHDPDWVPRTQTLGRGNDDSQPKYNLRSANTQIDDIETPVERPETDMSIGEPMASTSATPPTEPIVGEQRPPYPYSLRRLPERRNY
jgi:hypothetical protein